VSGQGTRFRVYLPVVRSEVENSVGASVRQLIS
jgi:hypothetical protein